MPAPFGPAGSGPPGSSAPRALPFQAPGLFPAARFLGKQTTGQAAAANNATAQVISSGGTLLLAIVTRNTGTGTGALTGVTDSAGNGAWQHLATGSVSGVAGTRVEVWACQNAAAVTSVTFLSGTSAGWSWNISEWPGLAVVSPLDVQAGGGVVTPATVIDTLAVTPALASDLVIAAIACPQTASALHAAGWADLANFDFAASVSGRAAWILPASVAALHAEWLLTAAAAAGIVTVALKAFTATPPVITGARLAGPPVRLRRPGARALRSATLLVPVPPPMVSQACRMTARLLHGPRPRLAPGIIPAAAAGQPLIPPGAVLRQPLHRITARRPVPWDGLKPAAIPVADPQAQARHPLRRALTARALPGMVVAAPPPVIRGIALARRYRLTAAPRARVTPGIVPVITTVPAITARTARYRQPPCPRGRRGRITTGLPPRQPAAGRLAARWPGPPARCRNRVQRGQLPFTPPAVPIRPCVLRQRQPGLPPRWGGRICGAHQLLVTPAISASLAQAGAGWPHGRWSSGPVHDRWAADPPHGAAWQAGPPGSRYASGSPHSGDTAGPPHR